MKISRIKIRNIIKNQLIEQSSSINFKSFGSLTKDVDGLGYPGSSLHANEPYMILSNESSLGDKTRKGDPYTYKLLDDGTFLVIAAPSSLSDKIGKTFSLDPAPTATSGQAPRVVENQCLIATDKEIKKSIEDKSLGQVLEIASKSKNLSAAFDSRTWAEKIFGHGAVLEPLGEFGNSVSWAMIKIKDLDFVYNNLDNSPLPSDKVAKMKIYISNIIKYAIIASKENKDYCFIRSGDK